MAMIPCPGHTHVIYSRGGKHKGWVRDLVSDGPGVAWDANIRAPLVHPATVKGHECQGFSRFSQGLPSRVHGPPMLSRRYQ